MPQAGRDGFNWLFFSILFILSKGFWWHILLLVVAVVLLILYTVLALTALLFHISRLFTKEDVSTPPIFRLSLSSILAAIPDVVFFLWIVLFLTGQRFPDINRAAWFIWAVNAVVGFLIGIGRGFGNAMRRRTA